MSKSKESGMGNKSRQDMNDSIWDGPDLSSVRSHLNTLSDPRNYPFHPWNMHPSDEKEGEDKMLTLDDLSKEGLAVKQFKLPSKQ